MIGQQKQSQAVSIDGSLSARQSAEQHVAQISRGSTVAEMWQQSCPARGWMWLEIWVKLLQTEIRDSAPGNRNWRASPERCRNAGEKKDPRVFFICTKGGRGGAGPDPHTNHSRNFRLEDPPSFFGQIFWEKILEIKIVLLASPRRGCYASSRSDSAAIGWSFTVGQYLRRDPFAATRRLVAVSRRVVFVVTIGHRGWPTGAAADFMMMRPTTMPSASTP
jgi:hypothetical protein